MCRPGDLSGLDHPADVIFPVLARAIRRERRTPGDTGATRDPFVGSGSMASRLGMNKVDTKRAWEAAKLPTPPYRVVKRGETLPDAPGSCVVKAISSGSSIDVILCKAPAEQPAQTHAAIKQLLAKHESVLVEQFIDGVELTVGLLEERALPPIRIVPKREFFDFEAKYKANDTEHRFDTGLPDSVVETLPGTG